LKHRSDSEIMGKRDNCSNK